VNIFSTFLFSDTEEIELLIIKIETEKYLVKNWIVVEGKYTFRGKQRNFILKDLVKNDSRLKPYASRIHILECHENFFEKFKWSKKLLFLKLFELLIRKVFSIHFASTLRTFQESRFFYAEKCMRKFATSKILELSDTDHDWILISDVDEILNIEDLEIRNSLSLILLSNDLFVMLNRQRFMFDFDNIDSQQRFTPLINVSLIRQGIAQISDFRHRSDGIAKVNFPYVVEYCFCMSLDAVARKLSTFSHIGTTKDFIEFAMKVNGTLLMPDSDLAEIRWLEKVDISNLKVPAYVKKHISTLKTNNVNLDYRENRKELFSEIFSN
jgi:hypothetical protein